MELLSGEITDDGAVRVTFAHETGVDQLEGTPEQIAELGRVMSDVCVLAGASSGEHSWLYEVVVGDRQVKLGLRPDGRVRVLFSSAPPE